LIEKGNVMYITLESDYAIRIVGCIKKENKRIDAKAISEKTGVTLRFALKILRKLVANGIIKSYKGTQGGYELAKAPSDISLMDIIETVEGKYYFSRCLNEECGCNRGMSGVCQYQKIFNEISQIVEEKLNSYTFDKF
jgi:Rrf2 family protein